MQSTYTILFAFFALVLTSTHTIAAPTGMAVDAPVQIEVRLAAFKLF
jgi:hypothetical protein